MKSLQDAKNRSQFMYIAARHEVDLEMARRRCRSLSNKNTHLLRDVARLTALLAEAGKIQKSEGGLEATSTQTH